MTVDEFPGVFAAGGNEQEVFESVIDDRLRSRMTTLVMRSLYDEYTQPGAV